jgi:hypothetical protein
MAKQTTIELVDDLDGSSAVATVQFGYQGTNFEIDLSEANSFALRSALEPYITAGRKTSTGGVKAQAARTDKAVTKAIREWAEANNWDIKSRGRIPHEVVEAYNAAA